MLKFSFVYKSCHCCLPFAQTCNMYSFQHSIEQGKTDSKRKITVKKNVLNLPIKRNWEFYYNNNNSNNGKLVKQKWNFTHLMPFDRSDFVQFISTTSLFLLLFFSFLFWFNFLLLFLSFLPFPFPRCVCVCCAFNIN